MKLIKYITIESNESFDQALVKIRKNIRESAFFINESPHKLAGNHKILKLLSKDNFEDFVKIDGPGFIIDKLYDYFIMK